MIEVVGSDRLEVLLDELAERLAVPPADPMAPEWIVVTSGGMQRWVRLQLARRLGRSSSDTDGVAANLDLIFPGRLRDRVLGVDRADGPGPWDLSRLPWAVLDVLHHPPPGVDLGAITELPEGATWWGRARRVADLFDRYALHRPEMIRHWAARHDVDGVGQPLGEGQRWQPVLWRAVRQRIGEPSPAELLPGRVDALRAGECPPEVPERVSLFGIGTIPGGAPFLDLLDALGTQRAVHLLLHRPSPGMAAQVRATTGGRRPSLARADDRSVGEVEHPLLRSWARPSREAELLLAGHDVTDAPERDRDHEPPTLLATIQADLRAGRAPSRDFRPATDDRSVVIHAAHGPTRQIEALRDQILHLLADDPTLTEDDVVVLCPNLEEFAPLIEAALGPSAEVGVADPVTPQADTGPPRLAYRVTDRSLRQSVPLAAAMSALIDLLGSRFQAPLVLEFVTLPPVRARFGFDDDDVATISDWVEEANVRWGLDGRHRQQGWNIPSEYEAGTWRAALDRVLLGVAVSADPEGLAIGGVLPVATEGGAIRLAGRFADLLARLDRLVDATAEAHTAEAWSELLAGAAEELFAVPPDEQWQMSRLVASLVDLARTSSIGGEPSDVPLDRREVRRVLADTLQPPSGRSQFFRGGVTFSSLTPLRALPHRVVCLLGMDEGVFGATAPDGDDLLAAAPHLGDRDPRADTRQALLEAVLAAGDHLVVVRNGTNLVTNQPVPPAVPVAELIDLIGDTLAVERREAFLKSPELVHPRQRFDERNFGAPGDRDRGFGVDGPWSFDPTARAGAAARLHARAALRRDGPPALTPLFAEPVDRGDPPTDIDLADLHDFLQHPIRYFLRRVMEISVPDVPETPQDQFAPSPPARGDAGPLPVTGPELAVELDNLEKWGLRNRRLELLRRGFGDDVVEARARAAGGLPPGFLCDAVLEEARDRSKLIVDFLVTRGRLDLPYFDHRIDLDIDGTRITGVVRRYDDGPLRATASRRKDQHELEAWLDLLVLTAADPSVQWHSVYVNDGSDADEPEVTDLSVPGVTPADRMENAREALTVIVDLFRRGQREPLPLFPRTSRALFEQKKTAQGWAGVFGGDHDDRWVQQAFGLADLDTILGICARADDPPGPDPGRARRYAALLWGAYHASTTAPEAAEGTTA